MLRGKLSEEESTGGKTRLGKNLPGKTGSDDLTLCIDYCIIINVSMNCHISGGSLYMFNVGCLCV